MRSPGVIYRKYRQLKKKYLYETIVASRKKNHENCIYGKNIEYSDYNGVDKQVRLCVYNCKDCSYENTSGTQLPNMYKTVEGLDVCTCPGECSAFAPRWTKEQVTERYEEIIKDPELRSRHYPELEAYQWVLDKTFTEAKNNPSFVGKILVFFIKVLEDMLKSISGPKKELG